MGDQLFKKHHIDGYKNLFPETVLEAIKDKESGVSLKDRLYYAEKDDQIRIYFYGRDFMYTDYWMIFMKRKNRKK